MLEKKGIEKDRFLGPKGSTGQGYGQPVEAMANRLNRLRNRSTGCPRPIEDQSRDAKNSLSPSGLLFTVEDRSRQR